MHVMASPEARDAVRRGGGRLFVWKKTSRCCGPITFLQASTEAPERDFRRVEADGIEVYFAAGIRELPDELHVELRGLLRKRLEAYWDGCAYVV